MRFFSAILVVGLVLAAVGCTPEPAPKTQTELKREEWLGNKDRIIAMAKDAKTPTEARGILAPYIFLNDPEAKALYDTYEIEELKERIVNTELKVETRVMLCARLSTLAPDERGLDEQCKALKKRDDKRKKFEEELHTSPSHLLCAGVRTAIKRIMEPRNVSEEEMEASRLVLDEFYRRGGTVEDHYLIIKGSVRIGMSATAAACSWGRPEDINRSVYSFGVHEQWVYGGGNYLYFEDNVLTAIQN